MFSLTAHPVEIKHLSFYSEKHGEESVHGLAIKVAASLGNSVLDDFAPGLRAALYRTGDTLSAQSHDGDALRFPRLSSLALDYEIAGARVEIAAEGLFEGAPIVFADAAVDKIRPTPKDGGSVDLVFRLKVHPDADQVARLYELQERVVLLTLTPPEGARYEPAEAPQTGDLLETADAVAEAWGERE